MYLLNIFNITLYMFNDNDKNNINNIKKTNTNINNINNIKNIVVKKIKLILLILLLISLFIFLNKNINFKGHTPDPSNDNNFESSLTFNDDSLKDNFNIFKKNYYSFYDSLLNNDTLFYKNNKNEILNFILLISFINNDFKKELTNKVNVKEMVKNIKIEGVRFYKMPRKAIIFFDKFYGIDTIKYKSINRDNYNESFNSNSESINKSSNKSINRDITTTNSKDTTNNYTSFSLINLNLTQIPNLSHQKNLESLNLENNKISKIEFINFKLETLKILILTKNPIKFVKVEALKDSFPNLEKVCVSNKLESDLEEDFKRYGISIEYNY